MTVFELSETGPRPFRRVRAGEELYESRVEKLLWDNLETFTGIPLFPLRRQASISAGGRPDILALAGDGSVFVVEVKRDIDRAQLAQCLEYAGWARSTNLDELAGLYPSGPDAFFRDWQDFTGTSSPVLPNGAPKLVLAAGAIHGRTEDALGFLMGYGVPVQLLTFTFYEDDGRELVDVGVRSELDITPADPHPTTSLSTVATGRNRSRQSRARRSLDDLIQMGLLRAGDELIWEQPTVGVTHRATLTAEGSIELPDGSLHTSPSSAGRHAAGSSVNGWITWQVARLGKTLDEVEQEAASRERTPGPLRPRPRTRRSSSSR